MFRDGRIVDQGKPSEVDYVGPISKRPLSQREKK
jgi:hypothetical protein